MPMLPYSLYESIFQGSPIGSYLLSPSADPIFLDVNDAFLKATSRKREELIGARLFAEFSEDPSDPAESGVNALRESLLRVISTRKPDTLPAQRYPIKVVTPDGREKYEERFWNAVNTPVFDQDGKLTCILHNTIDITRQVQAEEKLRESAKRLELATDAAKLGIWVWDLASDRGTWENDRLYKIFGLPVSGEPINVARFLSEFLHPEDADHFRQVVDATLNKGARFHFIGRFHRLPDRQIRWLELTGLMQGSEEGRPLRIIGTAADITEQKQLEEQLRNSERYARAAAYEAAAERHRLNAVLEAAPVGIIVSDADGGLLQVNAENKRLWGSNQPLFRSPEEYGEWKGWWADNSDRHGKPVALHEWPLVRALHGEISPQNIIEIEPFDTPERHRTILSSAAPIRDENGKVTGGVVAMMDITDRRRAEAELYESRERFSKIVSQAATGVMETDAGGRMTLVNRKLCDMLGYEEAELIGKNMIDITAPDFMQVTLDAVSKLIAGGPDVVLEKQCIRKDGSFIWVNSSVNALRGRDGELLGLVAIVIDITDRKQAEERVRHASLHDPLTKLPNRAMLFEYASHLFPHSLRNNQCAAVLFLDLDRFKPINDTHGHEIGDAVLQEAARRLASNLRAEDIVIRLGGDEFVILLQDAKSANAVVEVARHIIERINAPYHIGELKLSLSTSIGISMFPGDGEDIDTLISHADMAMYQAKQAGRNNFQFYSPEHSAGARLQLAIEQQLRLALNAGSFSLYYQPVVDLETGAIVSVEALLRWPNIEIGPDRFVPVAEATGIINPIGRWLLQEASRQHRRWLDHGLPAIPIAINVSVVEFRDRGFVQRFEKVGQEHGIDMHAIQLEVTETAVMDDVEHAVAVLTRLKAMGVKILLDDFGTGHSSLAYLARLPLNKVKIDKSFVTPLDKDVASHVVANAMIALGRTLELEVVAEGVETESVLEYIRAHGCRQAQGFYFSKPMSGESFETWYWKRPQHPGNRDSSPAPLH